MERPFYKKNYDISERYLKLKLKKYINSYLSQSLKLIILIILIIINLYKQKIVSNKD